MKKLSDIMAQLAYTSAKRAGKNASILGLHQPKEPKTISKLGK